MGREITGPRAVPCTKCGALVGHRCRTTTTAKVTDTHGARIRAYNAYLDRQMAEARRSADRG